MVQLSTTVILAALSIAPALAAPVAAPVEAREAELETREPKGGRGRGPRQSTGLSSALGQIAGQQIAAQQAQPAARDFDEFELEAREPKGGRGGRGRGPRQSTGLSSALGQIAGQEVAAQQAPPAARDFDDFELEARARRGGRGGRKSSGASQSFGNFAGAATGAAAQALAPPPVARDFDDFELEARARRGGRGGAPRQSTGVSSALGQIAGQRFAAHRAAKKEAAAAAQAPPAEAPVARDFEDILNEVREYFDELD